MDAGSENAGFQYKPGAGLPAFERFIETGAIGEDRHQEKFRSVF
jgi:hypothetical protein